MHKTHHELKNLNYIEFISFLNSEEAKEYKPEILVLIEENSKIIEQMSDDLKNDDLFMLEVIKKYGIGYIYASQELKSNEVLYLLALDSYDSLLEYAPFSIQSNLELVLKSVEKSFNNLYYAAPHIKNLLNYTEQTKINNMQFIEKLKSMIVKEQFNEHLNKTLELKLEDKKSKV